MPPPAPHSIVDGNVHLFAGASARADRAWPDDWPVGASLPIGRYLEHMQAAGISHAVLVTALRADRVDNEPTVRAAACDPQHLVAVGNLDVLAPGAADTLRYWIEERGMVGMRFIGGNSQDAGDWLDDARVAAVWNAAEALGVPVSAQRTRISTLPKLRRVLERYPDLTLIVYSAADPASETDVADLASLVRAHNVRVHLSVQNIVDDVASASAPAPRKRGLLRHLVAEVGAERVLWGSYSMFRGARAPENGPALGEIITLIRQTFASSSAADVNSILGGTAQTLYPRLN